MILMSFSSGHNVLQNKTYYKYGTGFRYDITVLAS